MPRGGARVGAGRPKKGAVRATPEQKMAIARAEAELKRQAIEAGRPAGTPPELGSPDEDLSPLDFLKAVQNDKKNPLDLRMRAAVAAAPYVHFKPREGGIKDERKKKAQTVGAGSRFAPSAPPLALVPKAGGTP